MSSHVISSRSLLGGMIVSGNSNSQNRRTSSHRTRNKMATFHHMVEYNAHARFPQSKMAAATTGISRTQRRLCKRHNLRHMHLRVVCSPTQPSQPAESALSAEWHTLAFECSPWYTLGHNYKQSRDSKILALLNTSQSNFLLQLRYLITL